MEEYQSIGFTKKTYGIKGDIKVNIPDHYLEDLAQAEVLFLAIHGSKIPYFVEAINFENPFTIKLEDHDTKEAVVPLTGKEIFMRSADLLPPEAKSIEKEMLQYEPYIGFQIVDKEQGVIGKIKEIIEYPQQEMAALLYQEKEILIPLNEQLIIRIEEEKKMILMDLPAGLFDLT